MLIPNHPDDERLSALASHDADAVADATLAAHVTSCVRCTELVDELGTLRAALADLPDLHPSRTLQLVPPVEADHRVDRLGGWARRFFAPVLTAGAALALVGMVGTAAPALDQLAGGAASEAAPDALEERADAQPSTAEGGAPAAESSRELFGGTDQFSSSAARQAPTAEQSPWPVILFAGLGLMIGAVLLRWTLVPRAG